MKTIAHIIEIGHQRTIGKHISIVGKGIFIDHVLALQLYPAKPNSGVLIEKENTRTRLDTSVILQDTEFQHTTSARTPAGAVHTLEHLLAAISAFRITNLHIIVDNVGHIPFFDGSAAAFTEAIISAGVVDQIGYKSKAIVIDTDYVVTRGDSYAILHPPDNNFNLTLDIRIEFPMPIGNQRLEYRHSALDFVYKLAHARTFMSQPWRSGQIVPTPGFRYCRKSLVTNMITHDGFRFNCDLRSSDECICHKAVDILGDLYTIGMPLAGHLVFHKPGHALMRKIVTELDQFITK